MKTETHTMRWHTLLATSMMVVPCMLPSSHKLMAAENVDAPERVSALEKLVLAERYREAYEYGNKLEGYWEGDENFDFSYGLAALESGKFDKAVFALERAQLSNPSQRRYRLELARAYFYSKNLDASEKEFKQVLETDPPSNVRQNIEKFLGRIDRLRNRQETTLSALLEMNGGYDSNVNSGPYLKKVPGDQLGINQSIVLNEDAKEQSSPYFGALASGGVMYPFDQRNIMDARVTGITRDNTAEKDYDLDAFFLDSGFSHRFYDVHRVRIGGRYQRTFLAGDGFLSSHGFSGSWNFTHDSGWSYGAQWLHSRYRYDQNTPANDPDIDQNLYQATVFTPPSGSREGLILHYGEDKATDTNSEFNSKYFYGVRFQQTWLFNIFSAGWHIAFDEKHFKARRPGMAKTREDASAAIGLNFRATLYQNISLRNLYTYTHNHSNLNFYRYRRFKAELALQMDF